MVILSTFAQALLQIRFFSIYSVSMDLQGTATLFVLFIYLGEKKKSHGVPNEISSGISFTILYMKFNM